MRTIAKEYIFAPVFAGLLACILMMPSAATAQESSGVLIKKDGGRLEGNIRWKSVAGEYDVTTPKGVTMSVKLKDVEKLSIKKPAELDAALKTAQTNPSAAIPSLENVMRSYTRLEWDTVAAQALAQCYSKTGNAKKAADVCDKVYASNPDAVADRDFANAYLNALMDTDQSSKIATLLVTLSEKAPRDVAAIAQIKRGDLLMKKNNYQDALLDGYLRTVYFYQAIKEVQPEALYKTVECFKKLGQQSNADKWQKKLMSEYPQDPYALKLKTAM